VIPAIEDSSDRAPPIVLPAAMAWRDANTKLTPDAHVWGKVAR